MKAFSSASRRIRKSIYFQRIATHVGRPLEPQKWVFVVGCYNSGTSLLADLLSQHPQFCGTSNEGVALTNRLARPESFGWPRLWGPCMDELLLDPEAVHAATRAEAIKRQWSFSYSREAPVLVEKSIANGARIPFFAKHFAPAFFVHIVRDGFAVAEGIRRKARPMNYGNDRYGSSYPLEACLDQWCLANSVIDRSLVEGVPKDNYIQLRYEDLCDDVEGSLSAICDKIGYSESSWLSSLSINHGSAIRNMNKRSHDALSEDETNFLWRLAEVDFDRWGYQRPNTH